MTRIYFFSPAGYEPMRDARLKQLCHGSHGWQPDGASWIYGVVEVLEHEHPADVADCLAGLGVIVLPGLQDTATPVDPRVHAALAQWVSSADHTLAIARKMALASGHPSLRPSSF